MTRYTFRCSDPECASYTDIQASIKEGPPPCVRCLVCGCHADRVWEPPNFICSGDPDDIPPEFQTVDVGGGIGVNGRPRRVTPRQVTGPSREAARRREKTYQDFIEERRRLFRENDQVGGRMTYQVPAELYWGKIKQTRDDDYWRDESNLKKHKSCKVS